MSTSPPPAALKKLKPSPRSSRTKNCDAAMNGVAMTTSSDVEKFAHTSSGMRKKLMPGARMVMIVTRKDRKSTRLNSSHANISYAVFCLKKKNDKVYILCL